VSVNTDGFIGFVAVFNSIIEGIPSILERDDEFMSMVFFRLFFRVSIGLAN
jgi:hypothetical protein